MNTLSKRIYNAITNSGPRTNNARALADEVEALEKTLLEARTRIINYSEQTKELRKIIETALKGRYYSRR